MVELGQDLELHFLIPQALGTVQCEIEAFHIGREYL
jgi:hypothetical protein